MRNVKLENMEHSIQNRGDALWLREHILEYGLDADTFADIQARDDLTFQDVFGENTLLKIEFDVAYIGEHTHFVFIPHKGADPEILTAYPDGGILRVSEADVWSDSQHSPRRRRAQQRVEVMDVDFTEQAWSDMVDAAEDINDARLNYNFLFQNSNSVAATLAVAANVVSEDLKGGGLTLGGQNILFDEIAGGPQAPKLMVRGGVSYFAGQRIGKIVPDSVNLDTDA